MTEILLIISVIINICLLLTTSKRQFEAYHRGRRKGQELQNMRLMRRLTYKKRNDH